MPILSKRARIYCTQIIRGLAGLFGSRLKNVEGKVLDRAFILRWGGAWNLIGISSRSRLRPVGAPQPRLRYWSQGLRWAEAAAPDFKSLVTVSAARPTAKVCHVIIAHLNARLTAEVAAEWQRLDPKAAILIVYGGQYDEFLRLEGNLNKIFVDDAALRTVDHAREKQEYRAVLNAVAQWLRDNPGITHVHLAEYDVIPLVPGLGEKLVNVLESEDAGLAGAGVYDLTGTIHPHYLNFLADTQGLESVRSISCREDRTRVLTMLGCTSIWTRSCLLAVTEAMPPERVYLEIAFATIAHHLGWRVRPLPESQQKSLTFEGDLWPEADRFRSEGAWMVHPGKTRWI